MSDFSDTEFHKLLMPQSDIPLAPEHLELIEKWKATPPAQPKPPAPVPEISGYSQLEPIGEGGMGVVYRGWDGKNSRHVAIKVMRWAIPTEKEQQRFEDEARAGKQLKHDCIIGVHDVVRTADGCPAIIMDYASGGSLWAPVTKGKRDSKQITSIAIGVCKGIQHAHEMGILHRDLKPANILLTDKDEPKVTDFGLAKRLDSMQNLTSTGATIGTPCFMAPEQAAGKNKDIGPWTDVYGICATLYYMLTEKAPVDPDGKAALEVLDLVSKGAIASPKAIRPEVDDGLSEICLKGLELDPEDRYGSAQELEVDLGRHLNGLRPIGQRPGLFRRGRKWARRNPLAATVMATLAGLVVGLSVSLYLLSEQTRIAREANDNVTLQASRIALSRGQRREALKGYDQLLADEARADRETLRVERLPCLFLREHWDRLHSEVTALAALDLPARDGALVLLHKGDAGFWPTDVKAQAEARRDLEAALAIPDGLRRAEAAYARGLLAAGTLDAIRHFEEALQHDALHPRAHVALLMEYALSGQHASAQRRFEFTASILPDEPGVFVSGAFTCLQTRDADGLKKHLHRLRPLLSADRFAKIESLFHGLEKVAAANNQGDAVLGGQHLLVYDKLAPLMAEGPALGLAAPIFRRPLQMLSAVKEIDDKLALHWTGLLNLDQLIDRCEKESRLYPEAYLRLRHANMRAMRVGEFLSRSQFDRANQEAHKTAELMEEVSRSPTLLASNLIHLEADMARVVMQASFYAEKQQAAAGAVSALLHWPGLPGSSSIGMVPLLSMNLDRVRTCPDNYDRGVVLRVATQSHGRFIAREKLLPRAVPYLPLDDARLLLADWSLDDPQNPNPLRLRATLEEQQGDLKMALDCTQRALRLRPGDADLAKQRARILDGMQRHSSRDTPTHKAAP